MLSLSFPLAPVSQTVETDPLMPGSVVHGRSRRRGINGGRSLDGLHGRDAVADHASGRDRDRTVRFSPPPCLATLRSLFL